MARAYFTARHVPTASALPEKLTKGRVYFVDDEGYIVIDHGDGPRIYGYRIGPAGRPGEPIPELQHQIDSLTAGVFGNAFNALESDEQRRTDIKHEVKMRTYSDNDLAGQVSLLSYAVMELAAYVSVLDANMKGTEAAIMKLVTDSGLHTEPEDTPAELPVDAQQAFMLHLLLDATDEDGIGDTFTYDGHTWDVSQQEDGTYILTLQG